MACNVVSEASRARGLAPRSQHKPAQAATLADSSVGDDRVLARSKGSAAFAALTMTLALSGCAVDTSSWFSKPLSVSNSNRGYTYSQLGEARTDRPVTANDLVDANGACPNSAAPAATQAPPGSADAGSAASSDTASLLGAGVALGMSECDVVARLGAPTAVNLGGNPNGSRSVVLTFKSGPRPGLYRFNSGRLAEMDRVEVPPPPPEPEKKKIVKKKPAPTKEPPKPGDKT